MMKKTLPARKNPWVHPPKANSKSNIQHTQEKNNRNHNVVLLTAGFQWKTFVNINDSTPTISSTSSTSPIYKHIPYAVFEGVNLTRGRSWRQFSFPSLGVLMCYIRKNNNNHWVEGKHLICCAPLWTLRSKIDFSRLSSMKNRNSRSMVRKESRYLI